MTDDAGGPNAGARQSNETRRRKIYNPLWPTIDDRDSAEMAARLGLIAWIAVLLASLIFVFPVLIFLTTLSGGVIALVFFLWMVAWVGLCIGLCRHSRIAALSVLLVYIASQIPAIASSADIGIIYFVVAGIIAIFMISGLRGTIALSKYGLEHRREAPVPLVRWRDLKCLYLASARQAQISLSGQDQIGQPGCRDRRNGHSRSTRCARLAPTSPPPA